MKKNDIRLYNVLFPIWFFFFFPQVWLIILPLNFVADSLVVYFSARRQQIGDRLKLWTRSILPVWIIGFASDFIGAGLIFVIYNITCMIPGFNPILFPGTTLISLPGVALAGYAIYWLNRKFSFRKSGLTDVQIQKLCLHLALWTAPYTMLIPLYG